MAIVFTVRFHLTEMRKIIKDIQCGLSIIYNKQLKKILLELNLKIVY